MEGLSSNRSLGKAMEYKYEVDRLDGILKKGKENVDGIKMKWVAILEELKGLSTQMSGINDSIRLAFEENHPPGSLESLTRLLNVAKMMGEIVTLAPLCAGAADNFIKRIVPEGDFEDFETIDAYVELSKEHSKVMNKYANEIRKLKEFENVRVTTVDEALFVIKYTKSQAAIADYLPREKIDQIQAAIDLHNAMSLDDF